MKRHPGTHQEKYCKECFVQQPPIRNKCIANKKRMLCKTHYKKFYAKNHCHVSGCKRLAKDKHGKCARHSSGHEEKTCSTPSCTNELTKRSTYCNTCYMRTWRLSKKNEPMHEAIVYDYEPGEDSDDKSKGNSNESLAHISTPSETPLVLKDELHKVPTPEFLLEHEKPGVWFSSDTASFFLCASEIGTMGRNSASSHFLEQALLQHGKVRKRSKGAKRSRDERSTTIPFGSRACMPEYPVSKRGKIKRREYGS